MREGTIDELKAELRKRGKTEEEIKNFVADLLLNGQAKMPCLLTEGDVKKECA